MNRAIKATVIGVMMILTLGAVARAQSIVGVWKLTEETTTGEGGKTRAISQPSLFIFTKGHYSIMWIPSDKERAIVDPTVASADELRSIYVDSFIANSGKYDYARGKLSLWPSVAKSPSFMRGGSYVTHKIKITGKTMTMTSEESQGYPVKDPTTLKLTRVE